MVSDLVSVGARFDTVLKPLINPSSYSQPSAIKCSEIWAEIVEQSPYVDKLPSPPLIIRAASGDG